MTTLDVVLPKPFCLMLTVSLAMQFSPELEKVEVNVWRPAGRPIMSSPLGFNRPRSMQAENWMNIELIYPDRVGQILGAAHNPKHAWFYQSRMTPDEAIIFNIYDNRGLPHLAHRRWIWKVINTSPAPRQSIESRTLVRY